MKKLRKVILFSFALSGIFIFILFLVNKNTYSFKKFVFLLRRNNIEIITNYSNSYSAADNKISIDLKKFKKLKKLRKHILKNEPKITDKAKSKRFKGKLFFNGDSTNVTASLTGQNFDHIENDTKWSLKISSSNPVKDCKKFKLLVPEARSSIPITELIGHLLLQYENLPNLKYEFVNVTVNGKTGIYAFEERIADSFFNRLGIEKAIVFDANLKKKGSIGFLKNEADSVLRSLKNIWIKDSIINYFNIDQLAKHYAIADLIDGHHCHWQTNSLYIFDAASKKISPLGKEWSSPYSQNKPSKKFQPFFIDPEICPNHHMMFLQNKEFVDLIKENLKRICSKNYINNFIESNNDFISTQKNILYNDYYLESQEVNYLFENSDKLNKNFLQ